jgi:hypothetical protein
MSTECDVPSPAAHNHRPFKVPNDVLSCPVCGDDFVEEMVGSPQQDPVDNGEGEALAAFGHAQPLLVLLSRLVQLRGQLGGLGGAVSMLQSRGV